MINNYLLGSDGLIKSNYIHKFKEADLQIMTISVKSDNYKQVLNSLREQKLNLYGIRVINCYSYDKFSGLGNKWTDRYNSELATYKGKFIIIKNIYDSLMDFKIKSIYRELSVRNKTEFSYVKVLYEVGMTRKMLSLIRRKYDIHSYDAITFNLNGLIKLVTNSDWKS